MICHRQPAIKFGLSLQFYIRPFLYKYLCSNKLVFPCFFILWETRFKLNRNIHLLVVYRYLLSFHIWGIPRRAFAPKLTSISISLSFLQFGFYTNHKPVIIHGKKFFLVKSISKSFPLSLRGSQSYAPSCGQNCLLE